jgi:hypothetical protein
MAMTVLTIETTQDAQGHRWTIINPDIGPIAGSNKFPTRHDMLKSLFNIFFGDYDETFLSLYAEWNPDQQQDGLFPEPVPVRPPEQVPVSFGGEGGMSASVQPVQAGDPPFGATDPAL